MHRPPPYGADYGRPPPHHYGGDYYPHEKQRRGNFCVRCICCCYCILFFLVLIVAAFALYLFTYYDPKWPIYKFEALDVKEFGYHPDSSLNADFLLTLKADNPNKAISIIYDEASSINVTYSNSTICSGKFPSFHHGHKNVTMLQIELNGKNQLSSGLYEALQDNERHGKIPLTVLAKIPFRPVLGDKKLRQFSVLANVTISVHDLKPGNKSEIEQGKIVFNLAK